MTASIKSSADGAQAIIQVNGVDKVVVGSDGSIVATANPATGLRSTALATMQKFDDEFASSLAANGYQKLPSGLIIQWGTVSGGSPSVTFPIAFPAACRAVSINPTNASSSAPIPYISALSASGFTTTFAGSSTTWVWLAIGN